MTVQNLVDRLVSDPLVRSHNGTAQNMFLVQRPSWLRTVFLYAPWCERLGVLTGTELLLIRLDSGLNKCTQVDERVDLLDTKLKARRFRRRIDVRQGRKTVFVVRGSEAERFRRRLLEEFGGTRRPVPR
jgi:hypothetical protein